MSSTNLKPSKDQLEANLDQFRMGAGMSLSDLEFEVLAAYGHELNHVFRGHLETPSSLGQETDADYLGGGLVWRWLHEKNIVAQFEMEPADVPSMCMYGFLHLISILDDSDHDQSP